jgi:dihydroorotate dehydrogenase electron transfer subunit
LSSAGCATGPHALSAAYYADNAKQHRVTITQNEQLARDTYRVRFDCPELASTIVPGQFLMLRLAHDSDPLLGRPFALYDTVVDAEGMPVGVDVVYLVVGKMTAQLANCKPGDELDVWGPLGNGFSSEPVDHLIMVAGGIGQTPFLALGREFLGGRRYGNGHRNVMPAAKVTMCYGVRGKDYLAGVEDFRQCGIDLKVSSDDGSAGYHGLVTELLETVLAENPVPSRRIACCGPERMMEAVAGIARVNNVPCEVSLETPMACGIGICFSCVVRTEQPGGDWDYKRTCVEGPVFDARKIVW